jgi:hypothetical protein
MDSLNGSESPPSVAFEKASSACSLVIVNGVPSFATVELKSRINEKN